MTETAEETRRLPFTKKKPEPGPVVLVGAHRATSPFAVQDAELVSDWLRERYGLSVVMVVEASPTQQWVTWPWYGWKRADVQN